MTRRDLIVLFGGATAWPATNVQYDIAALRPSEAAESVAECCNLRLSLRIALRPDGQRRSTSLPAGLSSAWPPLLSQARTRQPDGFRSGTLTFVLFVFLIA